MVTNAVCLETGLCLAKYTFGVQECATCITTLVFPRAETLPADGTSPSDTPEAMATNPPCPDDLPRQSPSQGPDQMPPEAADRSHNCSPTQEAHQHRGRRSIVNPWVLTEPADAQNRGSDNGKYNDSYPGEYETLIVVGTECDTPLRWREISCLGRLLILRLRGPPSGGGAGSASSSGMSQSQPLNLHTITCT